MDTVTVKEFETYLRAYIMSNSFKAEEFSSLMEKVKQAVNTTLNQLGISNNLNVIINNSTIEIRPICSYTKNLGFSDLISTILYYSGTSQQAMLRVKVKKSKEKINGKTKPNGLVIYKDIVIELENKDISFKSLVYNTAKCTEEAENQRVEKIRKEKEKNRLIAKKAYIDFIEENLSNINVNLDEFIKIKCKFDKLPYINDELLSDIIKETKKN